MSSELLLRVSGIETTYGDGRAALSGLSLDVRAGGVVAVLGANGAGKTTLLRTIAGLVRGQPREGSIELLGRRIERRDPEEVARRGVVYVPQDRGLFRELSVAENLELALWGRPRRDALAERDRVLAFFPILGQRSAQPAETLSAGEQQMLALARALLRRPRLLLLDEPSSGLAPAAASAAFALLRTIAGEGTALIVVEQNVRLALEVADEAAVLEAGRIVLKGPARDLAPQITAFGVGPRLGSSADRDAARGLDAVDSDGSARE